MNSIVNINPLCEDVELITVFSRSSNYIYIIQTESNGADCFSRVVKTNFDIANAIDLLDYVERNFKAIDSIFIKNVESNPAESKFENGICQFYGEVTHSAFSVTNCHIAFPVICPKSEEFIYLLNNHSTYYISDFKKKPSDYFSSSIRIHDLEAFMASLKKVINL